jgi:hypothetical protein
VEANAVEFTLGRQFSQEIVTRRMAGATRVFLGGLGLGQPIDGFDPKQAGRA